MTRRRTFVTMPVRPSHIGRSIGRSFAVLALCLVGCVPLLVGGAVRAGAATTALSTSIALPASGAYQWGPEFLDASARATSSTITKVDYVLDGNGYRHHLISGSVPTWVGWLGYWDTTSVPNGSYHLQSVAYDAAGQHVYSPRVAIQVLNGAPIVYVASGTATTGHVTPINTAADVTGRPIPVGADPAGIAVTPDGKTAYVTNSDSGSVTPIDLATQVPGPPISVGATPEGIAITPDGATAYVANLGSNTVTPIDLATDTPESAIPVCPGEFPGSIAIAPDGATAYVTCALSGEVTPIDTATGTAGTPFPAGPAYLADIAVTPDGTTGYVANYGSYSAPGATFTPGDTVTPFNTATDTAGTPITVGQNPGAIAVTPNGATVYVGTTERVTPIDTATNVPGGAIAVATPSGIAVTPDGSTAYVASCSDDTVTPLDTATETAGTSIPISGGCVTAIAIAAP